MTGRRVGPKVWSAWLCGAVALLAASTCAADQNSGSPSPSGPALISGHVYIYVGASPKPAPNATVTLYSRTSPSQLSTVNAVTDANGYYAIRQLQAATYTMFVVLKGYGMGCASNGITIDFKGTPLVQDVDLIAEGIKLYCPASPAPSAT